MFPTDPDKTAIAAGGVDTRIKDVLKRVNSGKVCLLSKVSDFYRRPSTPIVRSEPSTTFTVSEALLGFYGMSQFLPSSIYPILADFPPFLQTFLYNAKRKELLNHIITDDSSVISCLVPTGKLRLLMESYETFDQNEKELATIDLIWPKIEVFESVTANVAGVNPTVHCSTIRGKPDYIFVMIEHEYTKAGDNSEHALQIKTLEMSQLGEIVKSISELDATSLYHLTRRNSHIHADVVDNYDKIGAVLMSKSDCMDFPHWRGVDAVDLFPLDITVTSFKQPTMTVTDLPIRMKVFFIYTGFSLRGKQFDAKFGYN